MMSVSDRQKHTKRKLLALSATPVWEMVVSCTNALRKILFRLDTSQQHTAGSEKQAKVVSEVIDLFDPPVRARKLD
jgi:hypothetical protein